MTKYIYHSTKNCFEKIPKYIYLRRNGWFEIRKRIGGVLVYWGSFKTIEEAELFKAFYIGKNWEVNPNFRFNQYISRRGDNYTILKKIGNKTVSFGTFKSIEDARYERDVCVACDWDYDRIVEFED